MSSRRKRPPKTLRQKVKRVLVRRDGNLCSICCYPMKLRADPRKDSDAATVDHRVPRSRGGDDHISNLQLAHRRCNQERGVEPWSGGPEAP